MLKDPNNLFQHILTFLGSWSSFYYFINGNLHAFCSHGPLLQVSPEYQHEREICTFFASKKNFFSSTFLSFISPAAHRHLFLSARQFCRIRPQPISISVHHRAAFLTPAQNFATFFDLFPRSSDPGGIFPF